MSGASQIQTLVERTLDGLTNLLAPLIEPYQGDQEAPSNLLDRVDRLFDALLYILSSALIIVIAIAVTYSIFARYVLNMPPLWSEGAPLVFFVWSTFLALAVATRRGENIRVTYFLDMMRPRSRLVLELVMHALVIVMMLVIFWYSFEVIKLQLRGTMLSTGWNKSVIWFPLPIGMALMTLYQFKRIAFSLRTYRAAVGAAPRAP